MAEITDPFERALYENFLRLGLSEAAAAIAARGHDPAPPADPFDEQVELHRGWGLSEAGAKRAAIGRGMSEHEARRFWGSSPSTGSTSSASLTEGEAGPTGPAAMLAFHRLMGEARAWREAAALAESDALRAAAMDRSTQKFQEALRCVPEGKLDEAPAAAVRAESSGPPASRRSVKSGKRVTLSETQRQS